jgi:pimeloyl-ACP methyl ester carboxylesterase
VPFLDLDGVKIEYRWIGPGPDRAPTLVFLHEGLGSAAQWRDVPDRVAEALGWGALVYSRRGYGASDPLARPFEVSFMHDEAREWLPRVLEATGVRDAAFVGHSDGASIAIIHGGPARAMALLAPHVFVEPLTTSSIATVRERFRDGDLGERLARFHGEKTEATVEAWTGVWLSEPFQRWNIEAYLDRVTCPVLVVQGECDEYGTLEQVRAVARGVAGPIETLVLASCGHAPHRGAPEATIGALVDFFAATERQ